MKPIAAILVAILFGILVVFALKPDPALRTADDGETENLREQLAAAQREAKTAKAQVGRVEVVETRVEVPVETPAEGPSPQAILDQLIALDPKGERTEKRAVFYFESLVDHGDNALSVIRKFMVADQLEDKEFVQAATTKKPGKFGQDPNKPRPAGNVWAYFQKLPEPNLEAFPPSLRIGLLEVTANIGTGPAESLLVDILKSTARGVEVAYLEATLQKLSPNEHLELILQTTRELLAQLPTDLENTNFNVDRQSRGYLFGILARHKDQRFVNNAKAILVRPDGSLDGLALSYLRKVLGPDAVAILKNVADDDRITDDVARYAVRDAILHYIGQDTAADQLFLNVMQEGLSRQDGEEFKWGQMKLPMNALFRGLNEAPRDVIQARRQLFTRARQSVENPVHAQALERVDGRFEHLLNPDTNPGNRDK